MRDPGSDGYHAFNTSPVKQLRLVLKIDFPTPLYLASHDDIPNIPVGTLADTIKNVSSTSQRLSPDTGRSEIGSISLEVVDVAGGVSSRFNTEELAGEGLTDRKVELYRGDAGMDWAAFRLEQTQQISQYVAFKDGGYKIQCSDIQRAMRKDIFDLAKTTLSADVLAAATTVNVFDTSDFEACTHVASFGDQPTGSYFYFKIKYENGFEIVRATGKTATSFTGCTRGMFGTKDVAHTFPTGEDEDSSVEIEEYIYLELPAPAMAYALLTGGLPGGGTIPTRWNLGIPTANVDVDSFQNIGEDWFDSTDYAKGLIFRFQNLKKVDGKRFIEREVLLLAGAFTIVGADGKIYLKRMTGVLSSADYVLELTPNNVVKHGALKHNLSRVRNTFDIEWSWVHFPNEEKPRYVRRNILVDATSQGIHGESKTYALAFKGLHNDRHTYTTLINRFDALRDRFAGPPLTLDVELLPSENNLEVGDICRVFLPNVKDFTTGGHLDRSMEVQRIRIDQKTGKVRASLFGSSLKAEPIADSGAGANSELPDSWYSAAGTDFVTAGLSISAGVLQANGTLTGGTTTRTIFYFLGDFTIPTNTTLTVTGNVELRIRGQLQINGTLRGSGGMPAHTRGFIGTTYGGRVHFDGKNPPFYPDYRGSPYYILGRYAAMPVLEIENNSGVLAGIPADMRGSGGGRGGDVLWWNGGDVVWEQRAQGGNGGGGGGSVVTVSRGCGYGVSGETDVGGLNGSEGAVTAIGPQIAAGSGGGGAPGCAVHLLDGTSVTFPIIAGNVLGTYGTSPINTTTNDGSTQGKARASDPVDLGISIARAQYVPKSRDPYPDYSNDGLGPQDGLSTYTASVYQRSASAPATPTTDDGEYNFDTLVLTPPTGWSTSPPASDGNPLYVSTTQFQIEGPTGTDSTCVWTAPAILTTDGTDGAQGDAGGDGNSVFFASIFKRSASAPSTPTGGQYDFTNKALTPPATWSNTPPASDGNALYTCTAIAEINGTTGIDTTLAWSTPAELTSDGADGAQGDAGADGLSVHVSTIYRRHSSVPIPPTGGSYDFGTRTLTTPSLWFGAPPAGSDPLYVSTITWSVQGTTGVDSTGSGWTAVTELVRDGADGAAGAAGADAINSRYPTIYRLNSNTISSASGTFADPLAGNPSWSYSVPTMALDGDVVYAASRILTSDGLAPQEANWSTPAVYASRVDGQDGLAGDDGQGIRAVNLYKLNDSTLTNNASGSFADPIAGNTDWSYSVPAIVADGDAVYVASRTFTSDGLAPQDALWSTPVVYAQRTDGIQGVPGDDGAAGADAVDTRYPTIYRLNSNAISSSSGTFADPLAGNTSWSYSIPALAADGDIVYASSRILTSDGLSPQEANWSTPAIYAQRTDGADGATGGTGPAGDDGQAVRQVNLYRLNSNAYSTTGGTFADPRISNTSWSYSVPALATDGDIVYVMTRTFTDDGLAPQDAAWSVPTIYSQRTDGTDGATGGTGAAGDDGTSVHVATIYIRSLTDPGTPTGGQFVFGTNVLTEPAGWTQEIPADDGRQLWSSTAVFSVVGTTGTDSSTTWTAAAMVQNTTGSGQILSAHDWKLPLTDPISAMWDLGLGNLTDNTLVFNEVGPFGDYPGILKIRGDNSNKGWFGQWHGNFAYDNQKSYVFYTWVKRVNVANGIYVGFSTASAGNERVQTLAGSPSTNPYSLSNFGSPQLPTSEKWYLAVSIVWGEGSGITAQQGLAGIYDPDTGLKINAVTEFKWDATQYDTTYFRFGYYDNAAPTIPPTDGADYCRVSAYEMNGSEPSIQEVLTGGVGRNRANIVAGIKANYATFTAANPGEMYIHGLDVNGDPIDEDGSLVFDGARIAIPADYIYTNAVTEQGGAFIVFETGAGTPFTGASSTSKLAGVKVEVIAGVVTWTYDNNSAWTAFTPTDTMVIIGRYIATVADTIDSCSISSPAPLGTGVINAAVINATSLAAITATVGYLETRSTGGSPTTPRLTLSDTLSPLTIYDDDDTTVLFNLSNTNDGLRVALLGDFEPNSLNTSQAFSASGISELRGRLGLLPPAGGAEQRGGDLQQLSSASASNGSTHLCDRDAAGVLAKIKSKPEDITLTFKISGADDGAGLPGFTTGNWTIKWQVSANGGGYTDIAGASFTVIGNLEIDFEPGFQSWWYWISETQSYIWTGNSADVEYTFRLHCTLNSGTSIGSITVLTASEMLSSAGVLEAHVHDASNITTGVLDIARIPSLQSSGSPPSASQILRAATNGYIYAGWINTVSGARTTQGITRVYASDDAFLRYYTLANFAAQLDNQNMNFSGSTFQRNSLGIPHYITAGYASAEITVSGTAPVSPAQGDIWFDTAASVSANSISTSGGYTLAQSTGTYGGLNVGGVAKGGYYGIQLASELTFMWSGSVGGIYNHDGSDWVLQHTRLAGLRLYYANAVKLETLTGGVAITGNLDVSSGVDVTGNITVTGTVDGVDVAASKYNTTLVQNHYGFGDTTPGIGSQYLYLWRSSTSPVQYVRQASTGPIAKFLTSATAGATSPSTAANYFQIENDGSPTKGGLGIPYYVTSTYTGGKISVQATAPTSPEKGDIWFDTS